MARRYNVFHHRAAESKTIKRLINRTFRVISVRREHVNGRWNSKFSKVCEINSERGDNGEENSIKYAKDTVYTLQVAPRKGFYGLAAEIEIPLWNSNWMLRYEEECNGEM